MKVISTVFCCQMTLFFLVELNLLQHCMCFTKAKTESPCLSFCEVFAGKEQEPLVTDAHQFKSSLGKQVCRVTV